MRSNYFVNSVTCACCDASDQWIKVTRLPKWIFRREAEIFKCKNCGAGMTWPAPLSCEEYYSDNERYEDLFQQRSGLYERFAEELFSSLDNVSLPNNRSLLDIGCGGGFLLDVARKRGFNVVGIDANKRAVDYCISRNLNVVKGGLDVLGDAPAEGYGVIVLSAVLEHVSAPLKLLVDAKNLLSADGYILISQADYSGLLPRTVPWIWYGWQPEEHYWHFDRRSFSMLVKRAGLIVHSSRSGSLFHPWTFSLNPKEFVGRNAAALASRVGTAFGKGDSFDMVLVKNTTQ